MDSMKDLGQEQLECLLRNAMVKRDITEIQLLIEQGANVEAPNIKEKICRGLTGLRYFIKEGYLEIVKLLLHKGANIEDVDNDGNTVVMYAAINTIFLPNTDISFQIFQLLLEAGAKINVKNQNGSTVLDYISFHNRLDMLKLLCEKNLITQYDLNDSFLKAAAESEQIKMKCLIEGGATIDEKSANSISTFMQIVTEGHIEIVKLLIQKNKKLLEITDSINQRALMYAVQTTNILMVELLVGMGADLEVQLYKGFTLLIHVAMNGYTEIAKCFINNGANIEARDNKGKSALMYAVQNGHIDIVKFFFSINKELLDITDSDGFTLLMLAAGDGNISMVKLLLSYGVNIEKICLKSKNALIYASKFGHIEVVKLLIAYLANVNAIGFDDKTVVMYAARAGQTAIVDLLLSKGANIAAIDANGWTVLDHAIDNNHASTTYRLLSDLQPAERGVFIEEETAQFNCAQKFDIKFFKNKQLIYFDIRSPFQLNVDPNNECYFAMLPLEIIKTILILRARLQNFSDWYQHRAERDIDEAFNFIYPNKEKQPAKLYIAPASAPVMTLAYDAQKRKSGYNEKPDNQPEKDDSIKRQQQMQNDEIDRGMDEDLNKFYHSFSNLGFN